MEIKLTKLASYLPIVRD